jgi:tRNA threonylcarbamoyladenosine biosynthesis protein TsaE
LSAETTANAAETEALGARIAERLAPGDVVLVRGELGAGKTTLIRGACRALGVEGPVTSPTFTIGQRYAGRVPVSHLDLYRLGADGVAAEDPALLADYLTPDAVAFVEWAQSVAPQLDQASLVVEIRHGGGDKREISVESPG